MNAVVLSVVAALLIGANKVFFRQASLRGVPSAHLLVIFYGGGCIAAALFFPLPALFERNLIDLSLLVVNGLIWTTIGVMEQRVYRSVEASVIALLDSLLLLLLTAAGLVLFGEALPVSKLLGVVCIALAVAISAKGRRSGDLQVITVKLIAICLVGVALSIDKYLATRIPIGEIVLLGYALPGLFLAAYARPPLSGILSSARKLGRYSIILSVCSVGGFACTIQAFASGSLAMTSALIQTSIVFTFLIELAVADVRQQRLRPAICAMLCTVGAVIVAL